MYTGIWTGLVMTNDVRKNYNTMHIYLDYLLLVIANHQI